MIFKKEIDSTFFQPSDRAYPIVYSIIDDNEKCLGKFVIDDGIESIFFDKNYFLFKTKKGGLFRNTQIWLLHNSQVIIYIQLYDKIFSENLGYTGKMNFAGQEFHIRLRTEEIKSIDYMGRRYRIKLFDHTGNVSALINFDVVCYPIHPINICEVGFAGNCTADTDYILPLLTLGKLIETDLQAFQRSANSRD